MKTVNQSQRFLTSRKYAVSAFPCAAETIFGSSNLFSNMFHEYLMGLSSHSVFGLDNSVEVCQTKIFSLFHLLAEHLEMDVCLFGSLQMVVRARPAIS